MPSVVLTPHDGWAQISLNRPERRNAIDGPLGVDLARCFAQASELATCNALLLCGSGRAFCSGLDLKAFSATPEPTWRNDFQSIWRAAHRALFDCPLPIVCALERYAINGGAALALAADLLVVGEQSYLQVGEIQQGMAAPYNLAWMNLRLSETVRAQLALTGRRFFGPELQRLGISTECLADADVLERAQSLCQTLAGYPEGSGRRIKAGLRAHVDAEADAWFDSALASDPAPARLAPGMQKG